MKVFKILGVIIALIITSLVIAIYALPSTAHMERSVVINAQPDEVYRELISFRNFNAWSPWARKDTTTQYQYEGPEFGVGAKILWQSNDQDVGAGYMVIVDAEENKRVTSIMNFDGYDGQPMASFILDTVPEGTALTWTYDESGASGFNKIFLLGIEGFLGADYESGLQNIKERVESAPDFSYGPTIEYISSFNYIGIKDSVLNDPSLISTKMAKNHGELMSVLGNKGIEMTGYPVVFYSSYNDYEVSFTCGIPVSGAVNAEGLDTGSSYEGLVIKVKYLGPYGAIEKAYGEIEKFTSFYKYKLKENPWEEYVTAPGDEPDTSRWITHIYYPVE